MSDGQSDYERMHSSALMQDYLRKRASENTRIWETLEWVPIDPACYAMRPMTAAEIDLSKREHAVLRYWTRGIIRWGTPSRLILDRGLIWNLRDEGPITREGR